MRLLLVAIILAVLVFAASALADWIYNPHTGRLDYYERGVTNGNAHDHNGGDGAQISYSSLSGLPTLPQSITCSGTDKLNAYNATSGAFTCAPDQSGGGLDLSGEPFVTFSASTPLTAERVLTAGTLIGIDTGTAGQVRVNFTGVMPQNEPGAANNFLTAYNASTGAFSRAQPSFSNISGTVSIAQGGTTETQSTEDAVLVGAGTTDWQARVLPSCSNPTTSKLLYDTATNSFSCGTDQTGGGGSSPPWWGVAQWSIGDGDYGAWPQLIYNNSAVSVAGPTPTAISTSIARCVRFDVPAALTVNAVRLYATAATTNLYKFAIYPYGTSGTTRLWESGTVTTAAESWLKITAGTPFSLTAQTRYWWCVTAAATGTTAAFRTLAAPIHANVFGAAAAPLSGRAFGFNTPEFVQFAVSAGAFPATLPTIAAAAYAGGTTGTVPVAILDSSSTP